MEGVFLEGSAENECAENPPLVIGKGLSDFLGIKLGESIRITTQKIPQGLLGFLDETLVRKDFKVIGIYHSGSPDFERAYSFTSSNCAQKFANVEGVHEIVMGSLVEPLDEELIEKRIRPQLPSFLVLRNWRNWSAVV